MSNKRPQLVILALLVVLFGGLLTGFQYGKSYANANTEYYQVFGDSRYIQDLEDMREIVGKGRIEESALKRWKIVNSAKVSMILGGDQKINSDEFLRYKAIQHFLNYETGSK